MNTKDFKGISTFCSSESGVSTAVAAALLIGIAVIFMTTVQLNYMPVWKEDAEYAHMSDVWQDMSRFKSNVDILTAGLAINDDVKMVMNSPIRVGGSEIPFIRSTTTGGSLAINKDMSGLGVLMKYGNGSTVGSGTKLFYTGTVFYRPSNLNYVDETYCYENGALIISQEDRSMMKLDPGILLEKSQLNGTDCLNVNVRAVSLEGERGVLSSNSIEDIRLTSDYLTDIMSFQYDPAAPTSNISSVNLTIYTENTEAWEEFFIDSAEENTLRDEDYTLRNTTYTVIFSLHPVDEELCVDVDEAVIKIKTGLQ